MITTDQLQERIEAAWEGAAALSDPAIAGAVEEAIDLLDSGAIRVAAREHGGDWTVHEWVKKAILLYFRLRPVERMEAGVFEYSDKIALKRGYEALGVRVVPPAVARRGCHLGRGVVMMPSYVNIGARVGERTMVDTWATVGSCAQVGDDVHLSGGVGIGGVLEPLQATPVIIEDGAFIGSRCIVVEGVIVEERAVLGAGVVLTASTPIVDVTGPEPVERRGRVPAGAVVIPGTRPKRFGAGEYGTPVALIIGRRSAATDLKVSLNDALREHGLSAGS